MSTLVAASGLTGFIGRNLLSSLLEKYCKVLSFERDGIRLIESDKQGKISREDVQDLGPIDLFYNLATYYRPNELDLSDALSFAESNISFPLNILTEVYHDRLKVINFCSYLQLIDPPAETFYVRTKEYTKAVVEQYISQYCNIFLFDTFGAGDTRGKVVDVFIQNALKNESIKVPAQDVRINLTNIEDVCASIFDGEGLPLGDCVVHSPNTMTISDLASLIVHLTNSDTEILRVGPGTCVYSKCANIPNNIFKSFAGDSFHEQLLARIREIDQVL